MDTGMTSVIWDGEHLLHPISCNIYYSSVFHLCLLSEQIVNKVLNLSSTAKSKLSFNRGMNKIELEDEYNFFGYMNRVDSKSTLFSFRFEA